MAPPRRSSTGAALILVSAALTACAGSWQQRAATALRAQKAAVDAADAAVAIWYATENERAITAARPVEDVQERAATYERAMARAERVHKEWRSGILPYVQAAQRTAYEAYLVGQEGGGWRAAQAALHQALREAITFLQEEGVPVPPEAALALEVLRAALS